MTSGPRRIARAAAQAPVLRWLAPGWPDAGRGIVQASSLEALLRKAVSTGPAPSVVLNAGVGEGLYSALLRRLAGNARLVEFDLARPPQTSDPRAHRLSGSLTAIPVATGAIDLALCTEVLEHVVDDSRAVAELRRVLSPTGRLVLSVPTPPAVFDPAHAREGYTLAQLTDLFERHGLEVVDARYCMHACFKLVLRHWRPRRVPLGVILGLSWLDRWTRLGSPMDLLVLARARA